MLNEQAHGTSQFLDTRLSYEHLYEAALIYNKATRALKGTVSLTTVADQQGYTLDGDFLGLYLQKPDENVYIMKLNDGSNDYFLEAQSYSKTVYDNQTDSVTIPDKFSIRDDDVLDSQVTGSASAEDTGTGGKCTLKVATALLTDVSSGDIVHNTTDGSSGVVIKVASDFKSCTTCLFGGTNNYWESADAFILQPRGRFKLYFDAPCSTAGYTGTLYCLVKPVPVFSSYDVYRFPYDTVDCFSNYAAWRYKYRDEEFQFGDAFKKDWYRIKKAHSGLYDIGEARGFQLIPRKR